MEFIVEQQAAMNVRQDSIFKLIEGGMKLIAGHDRRIAAQQGAIESHDRRIAAQDGKIESHDRRIAAQQGAIESHDRQIKALAEGHQELVADRKEMKETLKELAGLHADTERKLNRLIETLRGSSNGRQTP